MELPVQYLYIVFFWILWCALHSFLISATVTEYVKKKFGAWFKFYRLFFNGVSAVTLIPLVYCSNSLPQKTIFAWEGAWVMVRYALLVAGISLFVAGARHYSMTTFLGISQIRTGRANRGLSEYDTFDTSGILGVIRHPWYIAAILIVWAGDVSLLSFMINIVISTYMVIGAILEERKLLREFGTRYRSYQEHVSMLIPYQWLKDRIARLF
jgi:protein-S-isoprenylcysteine O-methyltransferase Ste14